MSAQTFPPTTADRFWSKVDRRSDDECWEWKGSLNSDGYGSISVGGKTRRAHRVSYELHRGLIPTGMQIDHLCRVRHCVNPSHMEAVTSRENTIRGDGPTARFSRATHCKHGHAFTVENTRIRPAGGRTCRACHIRTCAERKRRQKEMRVVTTLTLSDRIALHTAEDDNGCLVWQRNFNRDGYGQLRVDGKHRSAHRLAYELAVGPIPVGLEIHHLCRNKACVNPRHLLPVTHAENVGRGVRMRQAARRTAA